MSAATERANLPAAVSPAFRRGGVYVVVGGAGGVGRIVSRHLASTVAARLVWVGRREPDARILADMTSLEDLGGQVIYVRANVADKESVRAALIEAVDRCGAIDGVFHSAVTLSDRMFDRMTADDLRVQCSRPRPPEPSLS